jgi:preprotein translocase subunit SecD
VGATLGRESVKKSLVAGVIGLLIVAVFMLLNYGFMGLISVVALIIYTLLSIAIFKLIPITLTLAGIAGFILSIGMAVDANILIFERMKEEERSGKSKKTAIELGFIRAWSSIKDSNISSLITCAVLYYFGTGMIRGFALTLAVGVLVSMFSAITVTETLLKNFYRDLNSNNK